jgi:hypothetical protein
MPRRPDRSIDGVGNSRIRQYMDVRVGRLRACRSVDAWVDGS